VQVKREAELSGAFEGTHSRDEELWLEGAVGGGVSRKLTETVPTAVSWRLDEL